MIDVLPTEFPDRNVQPGQSGFRDQIASHFLGGTRDAHRLCQPCRCSESDSLGCTAIKRRSKAMVAGGVARNTPGNTGRPPTNTPWLCKNAAR